RPGAGQRAYRPPRRDLQLLTPYPAADCEPPNSDNTLGRIPRRDRTMNPFDAASPLDARYYLAEKDFFERLHPFVSEAAQIKYLARVEAALAHTLADHGVCPRQAADEIARACAAVT